MKIHPSRSRPAALVAAALLLLGAAPPGDDPVEIIIDRDDIRIEGDVVVKPGRYRVQDKNGDGVLIVAVSGVTIDLDGVTLEGSDPQAAPDAYRGVGIRVEGRGDVTIRHGSIRGFKVGIYAQGCRGLRVQDVEVTNNFRQHLKSTPEREDGSDWLWPHKNDENQWMKEYGAGIYLDRCVDATVAGCRGRDQQNGIILSRTDGSAVYDNDFSYHSGWGLGMWRSSGNEVSNNRFDYCVRGYSHGVYHRGQDSAGILVFEQCTDNIFAYNSATHGGDGFFLYAGHETTRESGMGGCNRNIVYRNDFSHAVANGIEATFSSTNMFVENVLDECNYGIWAGYSYENQILSNRISRSLTAGVAIEHGHGHLIEGNTFEGDRVGIWLWWDDDKDLLKSAFARHQNTNSDGYRIFRNRFRETQVGVLLRKTTEVQMGSNSFVDCGEEVKEEEACEDVTRLEEAPGKLTKIEPLTVRGSMKAFLPPEARRGRATMMIDDWGPVDPSVLRLFPSEVYAVGETTFHLLGPGGKFQVVAEGVEVTPDSGTLPATIKVSPPGPGLHDFALRVQVGERRLAASGQLLGASWQVRFYRWDPQGPRKGPRDWKAVLRGRSLDGAELTRVDFRWGGGEPSEKVPADYFATVASTKIPLPKGTYEFRTISDDGVRLTVGGKKVIENWTWHGPTEDVGTIPLEGGSHPILLEHFEIDGNAELRLSIRKVE